MVDVQNTRGSKPLLPYLIGFSVLLGSKFVLLAVFAISLFALPNLLTRKRSVRSPLWFYAGLCVVFAFTCLLGVYQAVPEAFLFFTRGIAAAFVVLATLYIFNFERDETYRALLSGILLAALINSFAILFFAFQPDLYNSLNFGVLTGYERGARMFRSPGLTNGTDTAGFLSTLGIIVYAASKKELPVSITSNVFVLITLISVTMLTSRSSMLVAGVFLVISGLLWGRTFSFIEKLIFLLGAGLTLAAGIALAIILFLGEFELQAWVEGLINMPFDQVYAIARSNVYSEQLGVNFKFSLLPVGEPSYYDSTYLKVVASSGFLSLLAIGLIVLFLSISFLCMVDGHRAKLFGVYLLFFLIINLKNNYFFYTPFVLITASLLGACSRKPAVNGNINAT